MSIPSANPDEPPWSLAWTPLLVSRAGLPELANKHIGCPDKCEFQINDGQFSNLSLTQICGRRPSWKDDEAESRSHTGQYGVFRVLALGGTFLPLSLVPAEAGGPLL